MSLDAIGSSGRTCVKTPHLDKLRASGANFSHSYNMGAWGGAVCAASRSMLISGSFVNRAQKDVETKITWPEIMAEAGYTTYMTGKWHVKTKAEFIELQKQMGDDLNIDAPQTKSKKKKAKSRKDTPH